MADDLKLHNTATLPFGGPKDLIGNPDRNHTMINTVVKNVVRPIHIDVVGPQTWFERPDLG